MIEAAVRAGLQPCCNNKEGFWLWRFVGGPEATAFTYEADGDHLPQRESRRTDAAQLRRFFSDFTVDRGRLDGWQRFRVDEALRALGCESERQWLARPSR